MNNNLPEIKEFINSYAEKITIYNVLIEVLLP